jgi:two-component sensor histidine kinase
VTPENTELENENSRLRRLLLQAGIDAAESDVVNNLQHAIIGELHHRIKNLLAMVLSITSQSIRNAPSLQAANDAVVGRIMALSRSYDALMQEGQGNARLATILAIATVPFDQGSRITISVPAVEVGPSPAMALALVMNELATNATKYGSLSVSKGRVDLTGTLDDTGDMLTLIWTETGGPPVSAPTREGFGTQVVKVSLPGAEVDLDYKRLGLVCQLRVPLRALG